MSFNPNDNNHSLISRTNYEEYFLLYADNELTQSERFQVEQFISANPDLQPELELFLSTKLPIERVNLENKESLLAESMKLNAIDEALLLYLDNELNETEKIQVEEKLKSDKAYQLQYKSLLKTKSDRLDIITYPYKKELYHHEEKRRISIYWMRIAVAVIVLLGMGIFVFTYQQKQDASVAYDLTKKEQEKKATPVKPAKTDVAIDSKTTKEVQPTVIKTGETDDVPNVVRNIEKKPKQKEIKKQIIPPVEMEHEMVVRKEEKEPEQTDIVVNNKKEILPQQTINNPDVTLPSITSLNDHTTKAITAVQTDVVKTDNEKKSTLKGFLRKATRFIERRTNISTTNENDELLIGAVSLKL